MIDHKNLQKDLRICFFPGRESTYSRTRVLVKAMKDVGFTVYDCSCSHRSFIRYIVGFFRFLRYKGQSDIIFVGFFGHLIMPFARLLTQKKIIFDALISTHQTLIYDRKIGSPQGIFSHLARFLDRFSTKLADRVFLDTNEHINYYVDTLKTKRDKFVCLPVGTDDSIMYPSEDGAPNEEFTVHFHGEFQALHGIPYIIEAAKLLPDIKFQLIGRGRTHPLCRQLAKNYKLNNVKFIPTVPYTELRTFMSQSKICLGLFGDTIKTQTVIPHKVYEAVAMAKPVITADTPAIREVFTHKKNIFVCPSGSPKDLARAIVELKENAGLREQIAKNGYQLYKQKYSPEILGQIILNTIKNL